eukprot:366511-Chlamydomonas_euryale.AAC.6
MAYVMALDPLAKSLWVMSCESGRAIPPSPAMCLPKPTAAAPWSHLLPRLVKRTSASAMRPGRERVSSRLQTNLSAEPMVAHLRLVRVCVCKTCVAVATADT